MPSGPPFWRQPLATLQALIALRRRRAQDGAWGLLSDELPILVLRRWAPRRRLSWSVTGRYQKLFYELTTQSVRLRSDAGVRELLLDWLDGVDVVVRSRGFGHVVLWPSGCARNIDAALLRIDSRMRALARGEPLDAFWAGPLVLWNVSAPEEVAGAIARARAGLPLDKVGPYR